eukprot:snap_masked-scaffold_21-processed-gene-4.11-mRNA-1 protein AED:1.00 eAED:1.00 QI:0/0/0/0/1/1/2/0/61
MHFKAHLSFFTVFYLVSADFNVLKTNGIKDWNTLLIQLCIIVNKYEYTKINITNYKFLRKI